MEGLEAQVEVYRSAQMRECDERVLMLEAVGIPAAVSHDGQGFGVWVRTADAGRAYFELTRYARENLPVPAPAVPRLHAGAVASAAAFAALLFVVAALATNAAFGLDWYAAGALEAGRVRTGEGFRAVTALGLHGDLAHLLSNVGFGALFGGLVARVHGAGRGWLAVLVAAVVANLLNAAWMPDGRASIGASTAVFAALGLLAACRWPNAERRARLGLRGGSVVAALVLLALLGTGDARTDVAAHALGFAAGLGLGALVEGVRGRRLRLPGQAAAGALAVLVPLLAWAVALALAAYR